MENQFRNNVNPPPLDLSVNRYSVWRTWRKRWEDFYTIAGLKNEEKSYVAAVIKYTFTDETRNIYESLNLTEQEEKDPKIILEKLENFSKGLVNKTLERHIFNGRQQEEGEAFDDYLTELKLLSRNCNYCDNCYPGILRDRIVTGIQSDGVRKKLTLEKATNICRASEKASEGMESFKGKETEAEVAWLKGKNKNGPTHRGGMRQFNTKNESKCKFCVQSHPFGKSNCPALGKQCFACKGMNHFANSNTCEVKSNSIDSTNKGMGSMGSRRQKQI